MTIKQHILFYTLLLISCVLLVIVLETQNRNYIPIIWGVLGFGLYWFLSFKSWIKLSTSLVLDHKVALKELKINFTDNTIKTSINMLTLYQERKKLETISSEIKSNLKDFRIFFKLAILAFIIFGMLGGLVVIMAW